MSAPRAPRAQWADIIKGYCIILVVLWHVIMKQYLQIDWHVPVPIPGAWGAFGEQFLPLRMPVFFTVSGMFAAAAAYRPWSVVRRSRLAKFYYLYVLWFAVHTTVLWFVPDFETLAARTPLQVLEQLTITPTNLWYLFALAVYFLVAKVTRNVPTAVVLGAAFVLSSIAASGLLAAPGNRGQLYQNLFFFLAGLRLKSWVQQWAASATMPLLLIGVVGYFGVSGAMQAFHAERNFGVWPAVSILAVMVGVALAVQIERLKRPGELLAELGRKTLPIYVIHMPLVALAHLTLQGPLSGLGASAQLAVAALGPIVMTALIIAVCLSLEAGLRRIGAGWLFELPRFGAPPEQKADRGPAPVPAAQPEPEAETVHQHRTDYPPGYPAAEPGYPPPAPAYPQPMYPPASSAYPPAQPGYPPSTVYSSRADA